MTFVATGIDTKLGPLLDLSSEQLPSSGYRPARYIKGRGIIAYFDVFPFGRAGGRMRGFTVVCACLVILPLVLAYPWGEGKCIFIS